MRQQKITFQINSFHATAFQHFISAVKAYSYVYYIYSIHMYIIAYNVYIFQQCESLSYTFQNIKKK